MEKVTEALNKSEIESSQKKKKMFMMMHANELLIHEKMMIAANEIWSVFSGIGWSFEGHTRDLEP